MDSAGHPFAPPGQILEHPSPPPPYRHPPQSYPPPPHPQQQQTNVVVVNSTAPAPVTNTVVVHRQGVNHVLHFLITLLFWPWIIVWIILVIVPATDITANNPLHKKCHTQARSRCTTQSRKYR